MKVKLDTSDPDTKRILDSAKKTAAQVAKWPPWKRGWMRIDTSPRCDLCDCLATWMHPDGGFRCNKCPKP